MEDWYNQQGNSNFPRDLTLEQQIEQDLQNYGQASNFDTASRSQDDLASEYDPHYDRASQLNESMQLDFDHDARNVIIPQDTIAQIRQRVAEDFFQNNREYIQTTPPQTDLGNGLTGSHLAEQAIRQSFEETHLERTLNNDPDTRMERTREEQEIYKIEAEDKRSSKFETEMRRKRFFERLINLPASFPLLEDHPNTANYLGLHFIVPAFETITIEQPISNPMMNLSDQSRLKLEGGQLKSIKNRGKFKLQTVYLKNKSNKILVDTKKLLKPSKNVDLHQSNGTESAMDPKTYKVSPPGLLDLKLIGKFICQKISQQSKEIIQKIDSGSVKKIFAVAMQSFKEIYQSVQLVVAEKENSRKNQNQEGLDGEELFNQSISIEVARHD